MDINERMERNRAYWERESKRAADNGWFMECALWYVDTHDEWQLFYGYDHFHDAITDARGTLGIDQWAIARNTTVIAFSKTAAYEVIFLSQMLKRNRRLL